MQSSPRTSIWERERPRKFLAALAIVVITLALYLFWARPQHLRWGATDEEVQRAMAGDDLDTAPDFLGTRAVTIAASPEEIWPWLIQMGFARAGFYGFDVFEKVGASRGPLGVDRVLPQFQDVKVGDEVWTTPLDSMVFHTIQPPEVMVWAAPDASASHTWALYPVDGSHTRLVVRTRWNYHWNQPGRLLLDKLTEFTDHVAIRKVLEGIQGRAEGSIRPRADLTVELFVYLGALAVFVWAMLSVLRLPLTLTSWTVGLAGGLAWLITWYGPVSLWTGAMLALLVVWAVRLQYRERKRQRMREALRAAEAAPRKR